MNIEIKYGNAFAAAAVKLGPGESFVAEAGSMVCASGGIDIKTSGAATGGAGLLKGLGRMLSGESFFNNVFTAGAEGGELTLAPALAGDLRRVDIGGERALIVQRSSWLGNAPGVKLESKWGGFKTMFAGEAPFMQKITGAGPVIISAFGAIEQLDLDEPFVVDTGHIVAFDESLDFSVKRVGGWFSTFFSGEGLVARFSGSGRLWIQTRNPREFGRQVGGKLPPRKES